MAVFRESSRTRRRRKKKSRGARSDKSLGAGRVSSKSNSRKVFGRKKTTMIAKVMLATEFGKKQGGIQKVGSAVIEKTFSGEEESSRDWNDLLDPFSMAGVMPIGRPSHPPVPPARIPPTGGFEGFRPARPPAQRGFQGKGSSAVREKPVNIPIAGSTKLTIFLSIAANLGLGAAALWWIGQSLKGGNDTSTQTAMSILEDIQYAIYIDHKLISVLDDESFRQFMNNMKRNLQLRTRGLRSD